MVEAGSGFLYMGLWQNSTPYEPTDVVLNGSDGSLYLALTSNTGVQPDTSVGVDWDLFLPSIVGPTGNQHSVCGSIWILFV
jgi:hypothetical protein